MMKKLIFFILLFFIQLILIYSEGPVSKGNEMAFSKNEYVSMITLRHSRYEPFRGEIFEVFELNLSNKNYIIASIRWGNTQHIDYNLYTVDRQRQIIIKSLSLIGVQIQYHDYIHKVIMKSIPGIHLGNMPISIVDYNGDGFVDILGISISTINPVYGTEFGSIAIVTFDENSNDYGMGEDNLWDHFSIDMKSDKSPITFSFDNKRLIIKYVKYEGRVYD